MVLLLRRLCITVHYTPSSVILEHTPCFRSIIAQGQGLRGSNSAPGIFFLTILHPCLFLPRLI